MFDGKREGAVSGDGVGGGEGGEEAKVGVVSVKLLNQVFRNPGIFLVLKK